MVWTDRPDRTVGLSSFGIWPIGSCNPGAVGCSGAALHELQPSMMDNEVNLERKKHPHGHCISEDHKYQRNDVLTAISADSISISYPSFDGK